MQPEMLSLQAIYNGNLDFWIGVQNDAQGNTTHILTKHTTLFVNYWLQVSNTFYTSRIVCGLPGVKM